MNSAAWDLGALRPSGEPSMASPSRAKPVRSEAAALEPGCGDGGSKPGPLTAFSLAGPDAPLRLLAGTSLPRLRLTTRPAYPGEQRSSSRHDRRRARGEDLAQSASRPVGQSASWRSGHPVLTTSLPNLVRGPHRATTAPDPRWEVGLRTSALTEVRDRRS